MRAPRVETLALGLLLLPAFLVSHETKAKPPAAGAPSGGEKTISFPAGVEQVIVDVVVTDKKGTPQTGLTKDDLAITEDGAAQTIVSFEAVTVPAAPAANPAPRPRVSTNTSPEQQRGRTFVVVFDDIHLSPQRARPAKAAVAEFLKSGVREGDRVSLIATGGGAWWTTRMEAGRDELMALLKRLDGRYIPDTSNERVSDYEAMRIHMYNDQQVAQRVARRFETYGVTQQLQQSSSGNQDQGAITGNDDPYVTARATDVYFQSAARNRISLDVLERALNALVVTKGRKSLVLVSEGFIYDPNLDEFKRVIEASRRANTAIYFLNSKGLEGMPIYMTAEFGPPLPDQDIGAAFSETFEATEGSDSLSADSGGFVVRNTNDLNGGIKRIADENRTYYLVGYNPTNTARDGKFRKIQVKLVGKKGLTVRARKGYYAPGENAKTAVAPKPGTDPVMQSALDSPYDMENVPIRMTDMVGDETLLGKAATLITAEVDLRGFAFDEKDGRFVDTLDFLLVVAHRETGEYFTVPKKVEMKLLPATKERTTWYTIAQDFELKPGGYQAKMVVRDTNSGRVGTVVHEFDVPDLSSFRISTPVISSVPQLDNGKMTGQLVFQMLRDFAPQGPLFCRFDVFGAAKDPKSGMPRVTMGYQVKAADGSVLAEALPTEIRPTSLGKLARLFGFSLDHAAPGTYEIVMGFKDEVSGNTLQMKEPFSVVGATAAAPASADPAPAPTPVADKPSS